MLKSANQIRVSRWTRVAGLPTLLVLTAFAGAIEGQQIVDEGVLVVRRGREVIAREDFQVHAVSTGYQITSTVSYPPRRTRVVITSSLGLNPEMAPTVFESVNRGGGRVVAQFGARRVVFRRESERGESAREYPTAPRMLVVSDSLFALMALVGRLEPGPIRLMWPRADKQEDFDLTVEDLGQVVVNGRQVEARRTVLSAASQRWEVWFDAGGRMVRIRIPEDGIEVDRSWDGTTDR